MNANFVSSFLHLDLNGDGVEDGMQRLNPVYYLLLILCLRNFHFKHC